MKYIITGSLGHISMPIVKTLVAAGHTVTVVSSDSGKRSEIEQLGASAATGSVEDRQFLNETFGEADAVYLMIPPNFTVSDFRKYQTAVADNYIDALKNSHVRHVVLLSSVGAHLGQGAGPIDGLAYLEKALQTLKDIHVKSLRPSYFYYNLYAMTALIKQAGIMGANFGYPAEKLALVHTDDIARLASAHLQALDFTGFSTEYICSDIRSHADVAKVIGTAIGKPELPWVVFTDEEALQGMLQAGLTQTLAEDYVQMGRAFREGKAQADMFSAGIQPSGSITLESFAKDFAEAYRHLQNSSPVRS